MSAPKKGDRVAIINTTLSGRLIVEGYAIVVRPAKSPFDQSRVRFERRMEVVERWIDPQAQQDPAAYVAGINAAMAPERLALNGSGDLQPVTP